MSTQKNNRTIDRQFKAQLRDTLLLLREFRNPYYFFRGDGGQWLAVLHARRNGRRTSQQPE
jgi:hypothetical protein